MCAMQPCPWAGTPVAASKPLPACTELSEVATRFGGGLCMGPPAAVVGVYRGSAGGYSVIGNSVWGGGESRQKYLSTDGGTSVYGGAGRGFGKWQLTIGTGGGGTIGALEQFASHF